MACPRVIVNPIAGRGRGAAAKDIIYKAFAQANQPVELLVTTQPGDAIRWAYEAAQDGVPYVAGAGGDGTANEIMNGLIRWLADGGDPSRLPKLGMIPVGTGNDFGYNFALPLDVPTACHCLFRGRTRLTDVGLVESDTEKPLYFVNGVGLGFDAVVNIESRKIRYVTGGAVYLPAVLKTMLFYYRAPRVQVSYNGEAFEDNLMMISVMNGERFGAMFHMTPGSRIDDRLLSLCFVGKLSRPAMFAMVPRFIKGSHPSHPKVRLGKAAKVSVESDEPLPSHVDGEIYSTRARRYTFSIVPWQVEMICGMEL